MIPGTSCLLFTRHFVFIILIITLICFLFTFRFYMCTHVPPYTPVPHVMYFSLFLFTTELSTLNFLVSFLYMYVLIIFIYIYFKHLFTYTLHMHILYVMCVQGCRRVVHAPVPLTFLLNLYTFSKYLYFYRIPAHWIVHHIYLESIDVRFFPSDLSCDLVLICSIPIFRFEGDPNITLINRIRTFGDFPCDLTYKGK